ncbi:protein of unknown function [Azospirillum baldaniorum]|uniref:Uncharacterized protein n=1 Tax=Azospirillum baldaniorum TaxID=1064539 RepID=A0A9P1JQ73_9PROT|nr:protein of unknown function [Azospirillum baldaniorum]
MVSASTTEKPPVKLPKSVSTPQKATRISAGTPERWLMRRSSAPLSWMRWRPAWTRRSLTALSRYCQGWRLNSGWEESSSTTRSDSFTLAKARSKVWARMPWPSASARRAFSQSAKLTAGWAGATLAGAAADAFAVPDVVVADTGGAPVVWQPARIVVASRRRTGRDSRGRMRSRDQQGKAVPEPRTDGPFTQRTSSGDTARITVQAAWAWP